MKYTFDLHRPLSWSSLSSFEYSPEQWFSKYILKQQEAPTKEMLWGKKFADSCEAGTPLASVTILKHVEYPLSVVCRGVPLVGYIDGYTPHTELVEYKTTRKMSNWTQKKVDNWGQVTLYLLMLHITYKVFPEDIKIGIEVIQTEETGSFEIQFKEPVKVHRFETKRTMTDILKCAQWVSETRFKMIEYCEKHD